MELVLEDRVQENRAARVRSDPVFERNFGKWIGGETIAVFWGGLGGSSEVSKGYSE